MSTKFAIYVGMHYLNKKRNENHENMSYHVVQ